jgi:hypothetical protein
VADYIELQSGAPDQILMQDGTGLILLQSDGASADVFFENRHVIEAGFKAVTAAAMDGVLIA